MVKPDGDIIIPESIKNDAEKTLSSVMQSSQKNHSTIGVSEAEALRLVWNRINDESDKVLSGNLKETFVKQLASAVEQGHVVCSTGKISRIMSTLDGSSISSKSTQTAHEIARPMWAVQEELAMLAVKTRDTYLDTLSPADRMAYDDGRLPVAEQRMKDEFQRQAMATYRDELGMSAAILNPIIETLQEGF